MYSVQKRNRQSRTSTRRGRPLSRGLECLENRLFLSADPNWAVSIGGDGSDQMEALAVDDSGNTYTAARIEADSGYEVTVFRHNSAGAEPSPQVIATYADAGSDFIRIEDMAVNSAGTIILVAGEFRGSINLGSDHELVGSGNTADGFVAKYNYVADSDDYAIEWVDHLVGGEVNLGVAGTVSSVNMEGMALSGDHVYLIGEFFGSLSSTQGEVLLKSTVRKGQTGFLAEFPLGSHELRDWSVTQIQDSGWVNAQDILVTDAEAPDAKEIFVSGTFDSKATIGGQKMSADCTEAFIAKYVPDENDPGELTVPWAHQIAKNDVKGDYCSSSADVLMRSPTDGTLYVAGNFQGAQDFGVPDGVLTPLGEAEDYRDRDSYVLRINDTSGQPEWVHQIGCDRELIVASGGIFEGAGGTSLFLAGTFYGEAAFGHTQRDADLFLVELKDGATDYERVWQVGAAENEYATEVAVLPVGGAPSIYVLGEFESPLVPTMGNTLELSGSDDGMLMHVNLDPSAPQLTVTPAVTAIEQPLAIGYPFSAFDGDSYVPVDWTLNGIVVATNSTTYSLPETVSLGRYELTADDATVKRRHYFDVTPNAPSNLSAEVTRKGNRSYVSLTWTDNQLDPIETGFYVEYATPITTGWTLQDTLGANKVESPRYSVIRTQTIHEIRVRSFIDWSPAPEVPTLRLVSPVTGVVVIDPRVPGEYPLASEIAAAVDAVLADEELLKKKYV